MPNQPTDLNSLSVEELAKRLVAADAEIDQILSILFKRLLIRPKITTLKIIKWNSTKTPFDIVAKQEPTSKSAPQEIMWILRLWVLGIRWLNESPKNQAMAIPEWIGLQKQAQTRRQSLARSVWFLSLEK